MMSVLVRAKGTTYSNLFIAPNICSGLASILHLTSFLLRGSDDAQLNLMVNLFN